MSFCLYIFWLWIGSTGLELPHDYHISNTEVHYKSDQGAIQFTVHIFIDDFEKAIETRDSVLLKLFTKKELPQSDSLASEYLIDKLKVKLNGENYLPAFLGMEISDDLAAVWCYLEILDVAEIDEIYISNNILMEIFDDQKNIVNIKVDNKLKDFVILDKKSFKKSVRI